MRASLVWPLLAVWIGSSAVLAEIWTEDRDPNRWDYYRDEEYDNDPRNAREKRSIHEAYEGVDPEDLPDAPVDEEHIRYKRSVNSGGRVARQVHQYEVHESIGDTAAPQSRPYEEMLAASAEHYHRVYHAPGAPAAARYLSPVSELPIALELRRPVSVHVQHPPAQFEAPPLSVAKAVYSAPAPAVVPRPAAYVPVLQLQQLDEDSAAAGAHHHHHHHGGHSHARAHGHDEGGGHSKFGEHHDSNGAKSSKGHNSHHYLDKGGKGYKTDEHHRKEYEEAGGKKKKHHDRANHQGEHEEEAHGQRGSHFDSKKGHKKGHKQKGYHNKYHKDEFHKEHKFYDDFHKSGEHHRYGKFHAKHASDESGKKRAHHVNAGHDFVEKGKKGYSKKGHMDADHRGYKGNDGHEAHHEHHQSHGKKGGKEGGSHWGYQQKH